MHSKSINIRSLFHFSFSSSVHGMNERFDKHFKKYFFDQVWSNRECSLFSSFFIYTKKRKKNLSFIHAITLSFVEPAKIWCIYQSQKFFQLSYFSVFGKLEIKHTLFFKLVSEASFPAECCLLYHKRKRKKLKLNHWRKIKELFQ